MKRIFFIIVIFSLFTGCHLLHKKPDAETITVMTFNIRYGTANDGENRWELRAPILLQCIRQHNPDLLSTQESLPFQIQAIQNYFPEWGVFGKGRYFNVHIPERPQESMNGESCNIFYNKKKFELVREGTFWHSDTPDIPGSMTWGNNLPRIVTWGHFRSLTTGKEFILFNTHFHWGELYVANTTRLFLQKWHELGGNLPGLITGDFNLPPTSFTHRQFCGDSSSASGPRHFSDVWQALGKSEINAGTGNSFKPVKDQQRIDWILCTGEFSPLDIQIDYYNQQGRLPSDHYPVIAKLRL